MKVMGLVPVDRLPADCAADGSRNRIRSAGSKQAGIVLIAKSGDKGEYENRRRTVRRWNCDESADGSSDNGAVSRECAAQEEKERSVTSADEGLS